MTEAVEVQSVSRRFGRHWAVRKATASFSSGAVHVIIGHNGAGKSTLLALLAGALRPTDGQLSVLGTPLEDADASLRARIAWLSHTPFVYPDLTGAETLAFVGQLYGRAPDAAAIDALLERVGIAAAGHRKVGTYSRGMTQRLGLAAVLVRNAQVWLLDEPTTGLDDAGRAMLLEVLRDARAAGRCVVIVTHDPASLADVTDAVYRLDRGRLSAVSGG